MNSFLLPRPFSTNKAAISCLLQRQQDAAPIAQSINALKSSEVSEYSIHEEGEEENENKADERNVATGKEYAALSLKSATVQIRVGDLALARKAWKKRRRSGSPLLVPCSILNVDRAAVVRSNLIYLLYKFGSDQKDGIVISLRDVKLHHKEHLKRSLEVRTFFWY